MSWQERISVDPNICHGQARIRGTRVPVSVIVDNLADGEPPEAIAASYRVDIADVRAALEYAAEVLRERVVPLPLDAA